ncbi:MAG: AmmeMemoRadiSam system protein A [Candidatus Pacearchaeota archaeon]|nr:AmmeMemoRadiSam system protein A [Candidatus Pacearchaeota archaeon]
MFGEYSKEDGEKLLKLARASIEEEFSSIKPEIPERKQFKQARGVFVTLTRNKKLRGCIGIPYPEKAITQAIYEAAKSSAFSDPRFPSVKEEELKDIKIEISILTIPEDVNDISEIKVGRDGLICNYLGYAGLLLPQVATEYKMTRIQFLEALCNKAGLPRDNWQSKNFKIKKFSCQIFSED